MKRLVPLCLLAMAVPASPQQRLVSPEVPRDNRVTFRLRAPNAKQVTLRLERSVVLIGGRDNRGVTTVPTAEPELRAMRKDDQGVWSVTTELLQPDLYVYSFDVDGVQMIDPSNPLINRNLFHPESLLHVPGMGHLWDVANVRHGVLHRHLYRSVIMGDDCPFVVYTPPEYDPNAKQPYPVLYLLHGFSDMEDAWTSIGQANIIMDNLIARGEGRPMLIVMPLCYGNKQVMTGGWGVVRQADVWQDNLVKFRDVLLKEVMPQVENAYHVSTDRSGRAIAGLSMGGTESLLTGLNALDRFAWIGAFSSGDMDPNFDKSYPAVNESTDSQLRLLWIGCGQQDSLLGINQSLVDWMKAKKLNPTWFTTPGGHSFMVWRRFLAQFASLLFRSPPHTDSTGVRYFPIGTFGSEWQDPFMSEWYTKHLRAMGEPSLSDANGAPEFACRFLWLRTFHHPISVRIQKSGALTVLHAVEFDGAGGYHPGRVAKEVNRELSQAEHDAVIARLNKIGFWQMKTKGNSRGLDGAEWIFEGSQGGKCHVVSRWTPGRGEFYELCLYLVQLAGFDIPARETY